MPDKPVSPSPAERDMGSRASVLALALGAVLVELDPAVKEHLMAALRGLSARVQKRAARVRLFSAQAARSSAFLSEPGFCDHTCKNPPISAQFTCPISTTRAPTRTSGRFAQFNDCTKP
jgi:hypothetical protein